MPMHFAICSSVIHRNQCIIKFPGLLVTAVEVLWPIGRSRLAQQHFPREKPYTPMSNDRKLQAGPHLPRTVLPKMQNVLMTADLPIAVTCLAFQHLFAVAVKGVLLVFVVAVWFQVFTSPRAGRQLFSSPFAHYSFTNGFIWLIFKIGMKIFPAVHRIVPFVLFGFIGRSKTRRRTASDTQS